jgi:hypothetical protein
MVFEKTTFSISNVILGIAWTALLIILCLALKARINSPEIEPEMQNLKTQINAQK